MQSFERLYHWPVTVKKQRILEIATERFSEEGYAAVSTASIARHAQVSEGLIFRHFGSKRGLLDAILQTEAQQLQSEFDLIRSEADPWRRIRLLIDRAFSARKAIAKKRRSKVTSELSKALRATVQREDPLSFDPGRTVEDMLVEAFQALDYESPELEARLLRFTLDGIQEACTQGRLSKGKKLRDFLKSMYSA